MSVLETKNKPLTRYEEVGDLLRDQIETGKFQPGEQIPTEMELVREYNVARSTVRQAIMVLEQQGYLARRRGVGTFVQNLCKQGRPIQAIKTVGYLLVDLPPHMENGWTLQTTRTAHDILSERDVQLSISHLSTGDLFDGKRPSVLEEGACQAILLDGWVTDAHCDLMERLGLPYLVLGNMPFQKKRPQVRYAIGRMAMEATKYMHQLRPNQPVVLLVEPFALPFTRELFEGYVQMAYQLPQKRPILHTAANREIAVEVFEKMFEQIDGPFSLVSNDLHWLFASMEYRRRHLSPVEWPIMSIGNSKEYSPAERAICHIMEMNGRHIVQESLPLFLGACEQGNSASFFLELMTADHIEPPEIKA